MTDKIETPQSNLGERLLKGVLNLWEEVNRLVGISDRHEKILDHQGKELDHHGKELANLKARMTTLESEARGLRIALGKSKSKRTKLEAQLHESEERLSEIKRVLQ